MPAPERKVVLVVSVASPDTDRVGWDRLLTSARTALGGTADTGLRLWVSCGTDTAVMSSAGWPGDVIPDDGAALAIQLTRGAYRPAFGDTVDGSAVLSALRQRGTDAFAELAPPWAGCLRSGPAAPTLLATDTVGLFPLYWTRGTGWAAASNSSVVLARLADAGFDEEALGAYCLLGHHVGDRSPFAGVRTVPPRVVCEISRGETRFASYGGEQEPEPVAGAAAVRAGAQALTSSVGACLDAHPDAVLELSGGLDSRAVLAAMPARHRRGRTAVTLATPGDADLAVARALARRDGLDHTVVDLSELSQLPAGVATQLVRRASTVRDHSTNPLASATLDWAECRLPQEPRLTGQNGEYGRGFYHPGQHDRLVVDDRLVERLARWRLFTNEQVDPRLLSTEFWEHAHAWTVDYLRRAFRRYGRPWLASTDEFYLDERIQRWVGAGYAWAATSRPVVAPYLHERYLSWVRATDATDRSGSQLFARVVTTLDPGLAAIPLDSGLAPRDLAGTSLPARARRVQRTVGKVGRKVRQRARPRGRPAQGAEALAALVRQSWQDDDTQLADVARLPFLDEETVRSVATGRQASDSTSVAFLALLSAALSDLGS